MGAEDLRSLVELRESELLREELAQLLDQGIGGDALGEALSRLIRQSLEAVVQQALEGEKVSKFVERYVIDHILVGVAAELRDAQKELLAEARNDLTKAWREEMKEILRGSLREEAAEAMRQGIREGIQDARFRKQLLKALGAGDGKTAQQETNKAPSPIVLPAPDLEGQPTL